MYGLKNTGFIISRSIFNTLTPKNDEIISKVVDESTESPSEYFENRLKKSFQENYRV